MSGETNTVRIVVTADDATKPGFDGASAGAEGMAEKTQAAMDEYTEALGKAAEARAEFADSQTELTEASERVTELQQGETVSTDELAAAQDRLTAASIRSADARKGLADAEGEVSAMTSKASDEQVAAGIKTDESAAGSGGALAGLGSKAKLAGLAMAAAAVVSIKMAADWQQSLTQLVTGAGEPVKAMAAIKAGILSLSTGTDTSVSDLTSGLYMISSAGFHGAEGLNVLKAAAEGAKTGDASLADVANVLTSAMNAYHEPASKATSITNQLIATVASGKMHMQDLATSLSSVLPVAASAHISFAQVGGALATMTMQGMTARRASMGLANMIRALISPSSTASREMQALGLNANKVAQNVGREGLTGTLNTLTGAILRNSKGGEALAAGFAGMTPAAQSLARGILAGKVSYTQATTAAEGMSVQQQALIANFAKTAGSATGLKTTFDGAMKAMVGGATGLNVALLLGGKNSAAFSANVKSVSDAARTGGSNVRGWADIQSDFNFKLGQAGKAVQAVGYSLGDALLPAATKVMGVIAAFGGWLVKNKAAAYALAAVIVGTLGMVIGGKLVSSITEAVHGFRDFFVGSEEAESTVSSLASGIGSAASSIGSGIATAASSVVSFVSTVVKQLAEAAVATGEWIAEHAVATAAFIAENVAQAASATAAFIAENAATLGIVAGIALLVGAIIYLATHWKQVWDGIKAVALDAWHFIENTAGALWDFLKTRFEDGVKNLQRCWDDIKTAVRDVWQWIKDFIGDNVRGIEVILSWFGKLGSLFRGWWDDAVNAVHDVIYGDLLPFIRELPGRVVSGLSKLGSMLFDLGKGAMEWLLHGLESAVGGIIHTAESWGHDIANAIGGAFGIHFSEPSEATQMIKAGMRIAAGLGSGMDQGRSVVHAAAGRLSAAAGLAGSGGGYGAAGGGTFRVELALAGGGGNGLNELFWSWLKEMVRTKGGGGPYSAQRALGRTWPQG